MARVEAVIQFSETAPRLTATGSIWVVSIQTFASLNIIYRKFHMLARSAAAAR